MEDGAMALPPEVMQRMQEVGGDWCGLHDRMSTRQDTDGISAALHIQEASTMAHARHENVVNFMGICRLPPCILTGQCVQHDSVLAA